MYDFWDDYGWSKRFRLGFDFVKCSLPLFVGPNWTEASPHLPHRRDALPMPPLLEIMEKSYRSQDSHKGEREKVE
jgi:hypothetical protein